MQSLDFTANETPIAGINGFGRFGLGLFRAWFEDRNAAYTIASINDDVLTVEAIIEILKHDQAVTTFNALEITQEDERIRIHRCNGDVVEVKATTGPIEASHWLGQPSIIFDCSSRVSNYDKYSSILRDNTRVVLIGATTTVADATLIMGLNEADYNEQTDKVISFGSCTVIPGTHVINAVQSAVGVRNVLVNVVHSVPKWQLDAGKWQSIERKFCSLEGVAPTVLNFLEPANIKVNYTYAPYSGVSLMDFAFSLNRQVSQSELQAYIRENISQNRLGRIIGLLDEDGGALEHLNSKQSISLIESRHCLTKRS